MIWTSLLLNKKTKRLYGTGNISQNDKLMSFILQDNNTV